jgi:uridine phosphorylase
MLNHHRGLWGYTGVATDGAPLTVQASGLGGPSAALVVEDLVELGVRRLVRVGTCTALPGGPAPGSLLAVGEVLAGDGTSRALGAGERLAPDGALAAALAQRLEPVVAVSVDVRADAAAWAGRGARVADSQSAAVFAVAVRLGVQAAAVLVVAQTVDGARADPAALEAAEVELGRAALAALAGAG